MKPVPEEENKPPKPDKPPGKPPGVGLGNSGKTDEEIQTELEAELPTEAELAEFAREAFLRILPLGLSPEHFQREPTSVRRQDVERLWRHALQIAEVWHRNAVMGPKTVNAAVVRQGYRLKKFKAN